VPRRHRRIQRRDTTGNYVTNKGEWQRLGRGEKQRHITTTKDNKQRRLLRKDERQMGSTTLNIRNEGSFIETSPVRQERLTAAHLRHEPTARMRGSRGREIARAGTAAREVINTAARRRRRRCRPRAIITSNQSPATACKPRRHPAAPDSGNISVSVNGSMQSDNNTSPETPKRVESRKSRLQQRNPQSKAYDSQISPKPASSVIQHRIPDTTPMEKNERAETITTGKKKNHKHRFRRKKRQKNRGNRPEE